MSEENGTAVREEATRFGYELIRDHVLPSVLGKHESDILYWAGKELARTFPLFRMDEAPEFFREAGWGGLSVEREAKKEAVWLLEPDPEYVKRGSRSYMLEAGFLSGQYAKIHECECECHPEPDKKKGLVRLNLVWA
ncbi:YslB family protein [Bhargavaea cecembensis]|uniref:YslB family protein n=1 Tax=Bhargavaea cecembensis TaxID=394098 RepID=UPI00058E2B95|nr:YslB family protein [Bhargavaea cecembensis]